ncbi:unnamed protein product [Amoebophrya sp. A120]|nr:unnamed protein product [Amoebophrya sp. A120]|eukprot:GSA120T00000359001.1
MAHLRVESVSPERPSLSERFRELQERREKLSRKIEERLGSLSAGGAAATAGGSSTTGTSSSTTSARPPPAPSLGTAELQTSSSSSVPAGTTHKNSSRTLFVPAGGPTGGVVSSSSTGTAGTESTVLNVGAATFNVPPTSTAINSYHLDIVEEETSDDLASSPEWNRKNGTTRNSLIRKAAESALQQQKKNYNYRQMNNTAQQSGQIVHNYNYKQAFLYSTKEQDDDGTSTPAGGAPAGDEEVDSVLRAEGEDLHPDEVEDAGPLEIYEHEDGHLRDADGHLVDADGRLIDAEGRFIDADGRFIDETGRFVDAEGRYVDEDGRYIDEDGNFVDLHGRFVDEEGRLVDEHGRLVDEDGALLEEQEDQEDEDEEVGDTEKDQQDDGGPQQEPTSSSSSASKKRRSSTSNVASRENTSIVSQIYEDEEGYYTLEDDGTVIPLKKSPSGNAFLRSPKERASSSSSTRKNSSMSPSKTANKPNVKHGHYHVPEPQVSYLPASVPASSSASKGRSGAGGIEDVSSPKSSSPGGPPGGARGSKSSVISLTRPREEEQIMEIFEQADGSFVDMAGIPCDATGRLIDKKTGNYIDANGRFVDRDGYFVDPDTGAFVDENGYAIEDDRIHTDTALVSTADLPHQVSSPRRLVNINKHDGTRVESPAAQQGRNSSNYNSSSRGGREPGGPRGSSSSPQVNHDDDDELSQIVPSGKEVLRSQTEGERGGRARASGSSPSGGRAAGQQNKLSSPVELVSAPTNGSRSSSAKMKVDTQAESGQIPTSTLQPAPGSFTSGGSQSSTAAAARRQDDVDEVPVVLQNKSPAQARSSKTTGRTSTGGGGTGSGNGGTAAAATTTAAPPLPAPPTTRKKRMTKKELLKKKQKVEQLQQKLSAIRDRNARLIQKWWRLQVVLPKRRKRLHELHQRAAKLQSWWRFRRGTTRALRKWFRLLDKSKNGPLETLRKIKKLEEESDLTPTMFAKPLLLFQPQNAGGTPAGGTNAAEERDLSPNTKEQRARRAFLDRCDAATAMASSREKFGNKAGATTASSAKAQKMKQKRSRYRNLAEELASLESRIQTLAKTGKDPLISVEVEQNHQQQSGGGPSIASRTAIPQLNVPAPSYAAVYGGGGAAAPASVRSSRARLGSFDSYPGSNLGYDSPAVGSRGDYVGGGGSSAFIPGATPLYGGMQPNAGTTPFSNAGPSAAAGATAAASSSRAARAAAGMNNLSWSEKIGQQEQDDAQLIPPGSARSGYRPSPRYGDAPEPPPGKMMAPPSSTSGSFQPPFVPTQQSQAQQAAGVVNLQTQPTIWEARDSEADTTLGSQLQTARRHYLEDAPIKSSGAYSLNGYGENDVPPVSQHERFLQETKSKLAETNSQTTTPAESRRGSKPLGEQDNLHPHSGGTSAAGAAASRLFGAAGAGAASSSNSAANTAGAGGTTGGHIPGLAFGSGGANTTSMPQGRVSGESFLDRSINTPRSVMETSFSEQQQRQTRGGTTGPVVGSSLVLVPEQPFGGPGGGSANTSGMLAGDQSSFCEHYGPPPRGSTSSNVYPAPGGGPPSANTYTPRSIQHAAVFRVASHQTGGSSGELQHQPPNFPQQNVYRPNDSALSLEEAALAPSPYYASAPPGGGNNVRPAPGAMPPPILSTRGAGGGQGQFYNNQSNQNNQYDQENWQANLSVQENIYRTDNELRGLLKPEHMQLFAGFIRGFVTRHALARLWPQIQQTHDVYDMILDMEQGTASEDPGFLDHLYATLHSQCGDISKALHNAKFRTFRKPKKTAKIDKFPGWWAFPGRFKQGTKGTGNKKNPYYSYANSTTMSRTRSSLSAQHNEDALNKRREKKPFLKRSSEAVPVNTKPVHWRAAAKVDSWKAPDEDSELLLSSGAVPAGGTGRSTTRSATSKMKKGDFVAVGPKVHTARGSQNSLASTSSAVLQQRPGAGGSAAPSSIKPYRSLAPTTLQQNSAAGFQPKILSRGK